MENTDRMFLMFVLKYGKAHHWLWKQLDFPVILTVAEIHLSRQIWKHTSNPN